jgi:hypothetical protein
MIYPSDNSYVAIVKTSRKYPVIKYRTGNCFVCMEGCEFFLYSIYISPNCQYTLCVDFFAHFFINDSLTSVPEADLAETLINRLSLWNQIQKLRHSFWKH